MWKLRYEPRAYEYKMDLPATLPEMVVHDEEKPGVGLFLVALLSAILDLPVKEESGIEGGGK
jgi:hypothetical protein